MAGIPYATLVGVLPADLKEAREAFLSHTSRHQCQAGECETGETWSLARDVASERLEREMASFSPAPQRSCVTTFIPIWQAARAEGQLA